MKRTTILNFKEYLEVIEKVFDSNHFALYRAQNETKALIPSIARDNPTIDTSETEKEMIEELKRRTQTILINYTTANWNAWDWLVFAQHYGLKTRLLDLDIKSVNCIMVCVQGPRKIMKTPLYIFKAKKSLILDVNKFASPWESSMTKI
ncbi:MAG: FRG domain-containing protein [Flammeovirgaceae bacterium]|nr:FRG domain-containing protein [Flammeovirgaceae bacterium]